MSFMQGSTRAHANNTTRPTRRPLFTVFTVVSSTSSRTRSSGTFLIAFYAATFFVTKPSSTRDFRDANDSEVAEMSANTAHTASFSICPGRRLIITELGAFQISCARFIVIHIPTRLPLLGRRVVMHMNRSEPHRQSSITFRSRFCRTTSPPVVAAWKLDRHPVRSSKRRNYFLPPK